MSSMVKGLSLGLGVWVIALCCILLATGKVRVVGPEHSSTLSEADGEAVIRNWSRNFLEANNAHLKSLFITDYKVSADKIVINAKVTADIGFAYFKFTLRDGWFVSAADRDYKQKEATA